MKIFIIFLFQGTWMPSFTVFIAFNLNVNCVKNHICYENFHHISVVETTDAFFYDIYKIHFKCKLCKETITFALKIFIIFHVPEFMDAFFYGIYRIQFKCKLCKETITFILKIFIIFLLQSSWMP